MKNTQQNIATIFSLLLFGMLLTACSPSTETDTNNKQNTSIDTQNNQHNDIELNKKSSNDFPYAFDKITDSVWVMHGPRELPNPANKGFMNNPGLIKTSAGLVVIDPGSTVHVGRHVLSEIKKISPSGIVAVFNTHVHGDHWLANQAIKEAYPNVKIYGHTQMISAIEEGEGDNWVTLMDQLTDGASNGTTVVAPENAVDNSDVIEIGDTHFKIHHYGVAHTNTDIMIEAVEESIVFLGDNVLARRIPRMSDGTFQGSMSSIKKVLESNAKHYVPGHGPTGDDGMVKDYLNYVSLVYQSAQQAFEEDLDSSDVITISKEKTAAYKDWFGYDDLLGPQGAQAYGEVEESEF